MRMFFANCLEQWFCKPPEPVTAEEVPKGRVTQQMFHFGRSVVWLRDQPGWFIALTERDEAGELLAVEYRQLTPKEVALLKTMYPHYWGHTGRVTLTTDPKSRLTTRVLAALKRPAQAAEVVEFWALFYDPRFQETEAVAEVLAGDPTQHVGV